MKKIVSILMIAVMLVSLLSGVNVFASEIIYSSTSEWSVACSDLTNSTYEVNIANGVGYDSERSLHFKGTNSSGHFQLSSNMVLSENSTSDYTVSFKIRKSESGTATEFDCRMGEGQVWGAGGNIYRVTNIGTDWSTVERTFGNANVTKGLFFTTASIGINEFYIDDVKVTCGDTVLLESDFEIQYEEDITSSYGKWSWMRNNVDVSAVKTIVSALDSYNGNRSLHIKTTESTAVQLTPKRIESLEPTGTYTISFYGKGNGDSIYMLLGKYTDWGGARKPFGSCGKTEDRDGWIKYTHTVDLSTNKSESNTETAADFFFILIEAADQDIYIDDFKITNALGIDILDGCGSFESEGYDDYLILKNKIKGYQRELSSLISMCEDRGIVALDYEKANYSIINRFVVLLDNEASHGDYTRMADYGKQLTEIYEEARDNLNAYLNGSKQPLKVPRYTTSEVKKDGIGMIANTFDGEKFEERPVFFTGFGCWEHAAEDIPFLSDIGGSIIQTDVPMYDVLVPIDTAGWNVTDSGEPDVVISRSATEKSSGGYSLDIANPASLTDGVYRYLSQRIVVKPNTTYKWGLKSKGSGIIDNSAQISITGLDMRTRRAITNTDYWFQHDYTYTTESSETYLDFVLLFVGQIDKLNIDDIYLVEDGTTENLIVNGGFEGFVPENEMNDIEKEAAELGLAFDYDGNGSWSRDGINWLKRMCEVAEEHNVLIDVSVGVNYMPDFVLDSEEEMKVSYGKYLPFDLNNQTARRVISVWTRFLASVVSEYDSVVSLTLTGEPTLYASRNSQYWDEWQSFLKKKYSNLLSLNLAYEKIYWSFEDVVVEDSTLTGRMLADYKEFNDAILSDFHKWLYNEVKSEYPDLMLQTKSMGHLDVAGVTLAGARQFQVRGDDYELIADTMDINGCDSACWNGLGWQMAGYDMLTSMSEKPVWDTESHVTKDVSDSGEEIVDYNDIDANLLEAHIWNGAVHGLSGDVLWLWDLRGYSMPWTENPLYCNANLAHRPNSVRNMSKAALDLNRLSKEITAIQKENAEVGILHSRISMSYSDTDTYAPYYETICNGQKVKFVFDNMPENLNECKLLIVPDGMTHVKENMLNSVKAFIENGGEVLLLGENLMKYNEKNQSHNSQTVDYIYSNADNTSSVSEKIRNMNMSEVLLFDANTDAITENIEWSYAKYDGKYVVNIVNHDMENTATIDIFQGNMKVSQYKELRSGESMSGAIMLDPYQAIMVEFDVFTFDKLDETGNIIDENLTQLQSGTIRCNAATEGTLVIALYKDDCLVDVWLDESTISVSLDAPGTYCLMAADWDMETLKPNIKCRKISVTIQ